MAMGCGHRPSTILHPLAAEALAKEAVSCTRTNMKKLYLLSIGIILSASVNAQVLISILFGDKLNTDAIIFGIHVDYSFNELTSIDPQKSLGKLNLALFFDIRLHERW